MKYDDIINKEYKPSRPRMDRKARAKIFAPFSALSGYEESLKDVRGKHKNKT